MQIDIPEYEKEKLGKWIDYKRKIERKNQGATFTIVNFCQDICAKATYQKLAQGIALNESELYDKCLQRLSFQYPYHEDFKSLHLEIASLLKTKDNNDLQKAYDNLYPYRTYPFENILLEMIYGLIELKKYSYFQKQVFQHTVKLFPFLIDVCREPVADILLQYYYDLSFEDSYMKQLSECGVIRDDYSFDTLNLILRICVRAEQYYTATCLCDRLFREAKDTSGKQYYLLMLSKMYLLEAIQPNDVQTCIREIEEHPYVKKQPHSFHYALGLHYYQRNEDEKAFEMFQKSLKEAKTVFFDYIFCCFLSGKYGWEFVNRDYYEQKALLMEEEMCILATFYKMIYDQAEASVLENYVWEKCKPLISSSYPPYLLKDMLCDELKRLSEITGNKRLYYRLKQYKV